jgi:hypothetical protein
MRLADNHSILMKERILRNSQIYPTHHSVTRWALSTTIAFKLSVYFFDYININKLSCPPIRLLHAQILFY